MTEVINEAMTTEFYDAVAAYSAAFTALLQFSNEGNWDERVKLKPGGRVSGRLEAVAYAFDWRAPMLQIDGAWLDCRHKQLRKEILRLRPEIGDEVTVVCLEKRGSEYVYEVVVS